MSRLKPGDRVFVKGWPPVSLEVIDCSDRSIVTLKSEYGAILKAGRFTVIPVVDNRDTMQVTESKVDHRE